MDRSAFCKKSARGPKSFISTAATAGAAIAAKQYMNNSPTEMNIMSCGEAPSLASETASV